MSKLLSKLQLTPEHLSDLLKELNIKDVIDNESIISICAKNKFIRFWYKEDKKYEFDLNLVYRFLTRKGYFMVNLLGNFIVIKAINGRLHIQKDTYNMTQDCQEIIRKYEKTALKDFGKSVGSLFTKAKQKLLPQLTAPINKNNKATAYFYFENTICIVDANGVTKTPYSDIPNHYIWADDVIPKDYNPPISFSDFGTFLNNLADNKPKRLLALKTSLGYLMHLHKNPAKNKAVIFLDEIMTANQAQGGSGKSLLIMAISKMRNVVTINGKNVDFKHRFAYQRLNHNTNLMHIEDVETKFNFADLNNTITGDISVERKGKDPFELPSNSSPKVVITSNYPVKGSGGNSEARRRYDFEVSHYYHGGHQPLDDFKKLFFDQWNSNEWNAFHILMMECVHLFLKKGLVEAKPINIATNKLKLSTPEPFIDYCSKHIEIGKKIAKEEFYDDYRNDSDIHKHTTPKMLTVWLNNYAVFIGCNVEIIDSGGKRTILLTKTK